MEEGRKRVLAIVGGRVWMFASKKEVVPEWKCAGSTK